MVEVKDDGKCGMKACAESNPDSSSSHILIGTSRTTSSLILLLILALVLLFVLVLVLILFVLTLVQKRILGTSMKACAESNPDSSSSHLPTGTVQSTEQPLFDTEKYYPANR